MITTTNAIGVGNGTDGTTWAASHRLRFLGAPLLAPVFITVGDNSVHSMDAQVRGGIPPRREPH